MVCIDLMTRKAGVSVITIKTIARYVISVVTSMTRYIESIQTLHEMQISLIVKSSPSADKLMTFYFVSQLNG